MTTTAGAPPLRRRLISVDTALSRYIFIFSQNYFPIFLLHLLEHSADFASVVLVLLLIPSSAPFRRQFLFPALLGTFLDSALGRFVRRILPRSRPVYGGNMSDGVSVDRNSLPSGHASRVCFIAVAMVGGYEGTVGMVSWVVSGWAVTTSFSRVMLGRHHVSDVVAGGCLGALEAVFVFNIVKCYYLNNAHFKNQ